MSKSGTKNVVSQNKNIASEEDISSIRGTIILRSGKKCRLLGEQKSCVQEIHLCLLLFSRGTKILLRGTHLVFRREQEYCIRGTNLVYS
jgi:hypothetical protein